MINNSININKTNKQLSPQIIENIKKKKKAMTYGVGNPGPGLGQAQKRWQD